MINFFLLCYFRNFHFVAPSCLGLVFVVIVLFWPAVRQYIYISRKKSFQGDSRSLWLAELPQIWFFLTKSSDVITLSQSTIIIKSLQ